ncbi:HEXXH motif domain-containing protein [Actinophytocola sp.]|uniref:HEXXH motif domain-containing protein n=1 Tax=Actinophytocola sp. TaxID=1872138 RepID=UPI003D6B4FCA
MVDSEMTAAGDNPVFHRIPWTDLDAVARGEASPETIRRLRRAERSRRLLLLRALLDAVAKSPTLSGPLPSPEDAWDLLDRVQVRAPAAFDEILAHPYTGSWAGYTIRLLRNEITGTWPLWFQIGHMHAIATAAAIRAGIPFQTTIPVWHGVATLPSLGAIRLPVDGTWSTAEIRGDGEQVEVSATTGRVRLPIALDASSPGWLPLRRVSTTVGDHTFSVRLDDLDPFRSLYEPVAPERIDAVEVEAWQRLLDQAWRLITDQLPHIAAALALGLDSIVPRPVVLFRNASASTGEAFGSAIIARHSDPASLAAILVHEFNHIVLGGVLHLIRLHDDDPRMRFYAPWRDDPRPLDRVLQGVYAHVGVAEFWRAMSHVDGRPDQRRAATEFAFWRGQTWRALTAIRGDATLTEAGHRFVDGIAARIGPWQHEPVPKHVAEAADALATDHYAGWRIRHLRPRPELVETVVEAWRAGRRQPPVIDAMSDPLPTPVPDGDWSHARADLIRYQLGTEPTIDPLGAVPDATAADLAYAAGQHASAAAGYRAELSVDPDRPDSLVGLGLALTARGVNPAARALLGRPELVRAVHRRLREHAESVPSPEQLASWIGAMAN